MHVLVAAWVLLGYDRWDLIPPLGGQRRRGRAFPGLSV
jgi:hypothetical protein